MSTFANAHDGDVAEREALKPSLPAMVHLEREPNWLTAWSKSARNRRSTAGLRTAVASTVCGLVDDVLDQLRLVAVRVAAAVHDLDDDLFARVATLNLERQHATDQGKERGGMFPGLQGEISDDAFPAPSFFSGLEGRAVGNGDQGRGPRWRPGADLLARLTTRLCR